MEEDELYNMTVDEVAKRIDRSPTWVRIGLQQKRLPFRHSSTK